MEKPNGTLLSCSLAIPAMCSCRFRVKYVSDTSNLLSIKCNGAQRYPRDYASNSLGALNHEFKSLQSNCGLSAYAYITSSPPGEH